MGGAASKAKGSQFERDICTKLSLWVTDGARKDVFWRSAMSGGRATVARSRGKDVRQAGDITAVAPEGHELTDRVFIECKHYRDLQLEAYVTAGKGALAKFYEHACNEAEKRGKVPWLIAKQNMRPTLLLLDEGAGTFMPVNPICRVRRYKSNYTNVWLFDEILRFKPPKEYIWLGSPSSSSTGTVSSTSTRKVGRVRP